MSVDIDLPGIVHYSLENFVFPFFSTALPPFPQGAATDNANRRSRRQHNGY